MTTIISEHIQITLVFAVTSLTLQGIGFEFNIENTKLVNDANFLQLKKDLDELAVKIAGERSK